MDWMFGVLLGFSYCNFKKNNNKRDFYRITCFLILAFNIFVIFNLNDGNTEFKASNDDIIDRIRYEKVNDQQFKITDTNVEDEQKIVDNEVINFPISFSSKFGGFRSDYGESVDTDSLDNIILAGYTESDDFPTKNAFDNSFNDDYYHYPKYDGFVTKFSKNGELLWSTYLGGSDIDFGYVVAVDSSDNIIVTGCTESDDFPTNNAYDSIYNGDLEVFITKFSSNGTLLWSTYLGGIGEESGNAIDIDSNDNIIITGYTSSDDFPTLNAYDSSYNGGTDIFIAKFSTNGELLLSTYLGGSDYESAKSITVDKNNSILLTGYTSSDDFPTLNAYDNTYNNGIDTFISKFSSNCVMKWSTFLGGNSQDIGCSIVLDSLENIIITGNTLSNDFPKLLINYNFRLNLSNIFVSKFSQDGLLYWSTKLGGESNDYCYNAAIDTFDRIIITGETESINFPIVNALQQNKWGGVDCFITLFSSNGFINSSTYFGGSEDDSCKDLAIDKEGNIIITGFTDEDSDFPVINNNLEYINSYFSCCFLTKFKSLIIPKIYEYKYEIQDSNLLGGSYGEYGDSSSNDIKIDVFGNSILVGETETMNIPIINAYQNTKSSSNYDAFITKFSNNGSILWSTYLGGFSADYGKSLGIDNFNNIIVVGNTLSDDFPTLNAYDSSYNGAYDGFISKFSSNGSLIWSTFIGGINDDFCNKIEIDSSNNIIITGETHSIDYPILKPFDDTLNGFSDVFITKFSSDGSLLWSSYLGGELLEYGEDIALDKYNNIIIVGSTSSRDFPKFDGQYSSNTGNFDVFLTKISTKGSLIMSTYFGGNSDDFGKCIEPDNFNNFIIAGITYSNDYPTTNSFNSNNNGSSNIFVTKFTSYNTILWSTFIGGSSYDTVTDIIVDSKNEIFIAGYTGSLDISMNISTNFNRIFKQFGLLIKFNSKGIIQNVNIFDSGTKFLFNAIEYSLFYDEIIIVGSQSESNVLLNEFYSDLNNLNDNAFLIKLNYNFTQPDIQKVDQLHRMIKILFDFFEFVFFFVLFLVILFSLTIFFPIFSIKSINTNIIIKKRVEAIEEIIEDTRSLTYNNSLEIEKDSLFWNISSEFCRLNQLNTLLRKKGINKEKVDKIIDKLPLSFDSDHESFFIALNKVISKRNGFHYLIYLNSRIYERINSDLFKLKSKDNEFLIQIWTLPFYSYNNKSDYPDLIVTNNHHKLLASLITNIEHLEHLQWELLPQLANLTIDYLSFNEENNIQNSYLEIAISTLSLDYKILFSEFVSKSNNIQNLNTINTILKTITIKELIDLPEMKLEMIIRRIAKLNINNYPLPNENDDIIEISIAKRKYLVSLLNQSKIKISKELLSELLN